MRFACPLSLLHSASLRILQNMTSCRLLAPLSRVSSSTAAGPPAAPQAPPTGGRLRAGKNVFFQVCGGRMAAAKRPQNGPPAPTNSWPRPEAERGWSNAQARLRSSAQARLLLNFDAGRHTHGQWFYILHSWPCQTLVKYGVACHIQSYHT